MDRCKENKICNFRHKMFKKKCKLFYIDKRQKKKKRNLNPSIEAKFEFKFTGI